MLNKQKIIKLFVFSLVIFTLLLNLINLAFVENIARCLFYGKISIWSFWAIIISFLIVSIGFVLAKLKIILFFSEDWKCLRILIFTVFLSAFIFVYVSLIEAENYYLA